MKMLVNAKRIKQLRDQKCWSQLQLSEMAGISLRTLQRVEAKSVASQETVKSIASVLEVDCDTLLADQPLPMQSEPVESDNMKLSENVQTGSHEHEPQAISQTLLKRRLLIAAFMVAFAAAFGFWGVFSAYAENRIDQEQFSLLKNLVSIGLLVGLAGVGYRAFKAGLISRSDFY
ncbi:helix-turn-helix domain-containing protein [Aliiglaciecola sp. M165]|uniref:helix-turn-helix domain-containing protein n=1 Tax=Aliiglaciecola sp. M165 TaxID=2593649 RepID=UPI0021B0A5E9|nr:helix-turn-helix transcriptional regulator [Aliiglaciecola sp. M165]